MKLKIMTSDAIAYIKKNIDGVVEHYRNGDDPEKWIKLKIGKIPFIEVEGIEFNDFDLIVNEDKPSANDVLNIKQMYTNLIELNDSFATDERLWAGLSHTLFYEYMQKRWAGKDVDAKSILNHYFFTSGKPRCYMINTLARLWWIGRKTYIKDEEDSFKILDYIAHDINGYSFTLFGSNWSNSDISMRIFFEAVFEFEKEKNLSVDRGLFNDTMQYVNALCGIYTIDACDSTFVKNKIKEYLVQRSMEIQEELKNNKENNVKTTGINKFDNIIKALNKAGGIATQKEIVNNYFDISDKELSKATIDYISESIKKNCPTAKEFDGKPIFHVITIDGETKLKIAIDYLVKTNIEHYKTVINSQISTLNDDDKIVFNVITSFKKDKFNKNDLLFYRTQLEQLYPSISNIEDFISKSLNAIYAKGLIEFDGLKEYRKSYKY